MSRSGHKHKPTFEGGQMRLIRRIPKRGFNEPLRAPSSSPSTSAILERFEDGRRGHGGDLARGRPGQGTRSDGSRSSGRAKLDRKLTVKAHAFSASARAKIEAAGGTCEVV